MKSLLAGLLAAIAIGLPSAAHAQWTGDEIKSAKYSMKYCTRKGYFDNRGPDPSELYLACGGKAAIVGDIAHASAWLDEAKRLIDAMPVEQRHQQAALLKLTGDVAFAKGQYAEARDAWRELYARQIELEVLAGDNGSFIDYRRLGQRLIELDNKVIVQEIDATGKRHPELAATARSLLTDVARFHDVAASPADLSALEARARQILAVDPGDIMAHIALVFVDSARSDCPAAIRDAKAEIDASQFGGFWVMHQKIARCLGNSGKLEESLAAYDTAIRVAPWVTDNRIERDVILQLIEKRDHPKAFDLYAAARDGTNGMGKPDSEERIVAAWGNINKAIAISPDFPLARALRTVLFSKNFTLVWKADTDQVRRTVEADAMRAYALNPESIESALAVGLAFYQKPKSEYNMTMWRSKLWFDLARTRAPDNQAAQTFYDLASQARWQLTAEEQRQRDAENAAYVQRMAEARRIQEERERQKSSQGDFFANMQAWCDSIGASSMQIMAAVPPACYAHIRH